MVKEKFLLACMNILEINLNLSDEKYFNKSVVLVYDLNSPLSIELSSWYISALKNLQLSSSKKNGGKKYEIINYNEIDKIELKDKLMWLKEDSTVILVSSTNFRLDDFRIRLNLHNKWVWCLEHNHLGYIKDNETENYADAIEYKTNYYDEIWNKLKNISDNAKAMKFVCIDWSTLNIDWWFEDMKLNTWNYENKRRWWSFPVWEVFTESKIFDNVNGELSIYAFPDDKLQVNFCTPFKIKIQNSIVTCDDETCPENFRHTINKISEAEDGEVMLRELWFWLNTWITKENPLSDINAFERIAWFHVSLWKKHQIYRKKIDKNTIQRYHIDIFPNIKEIYYDDIKVFEFNNYII